MATQELPVLDCSLTDVVVNADAKAKTVGDLMEMKCVGLMAEVPTDTAEIVFPAAENKYALHLLKMIKADPGEFTASVTSYLPGDFKGQEVHLKVGERVYNLRNLEWSYGSVLEEAQQLQKETVEPPPEEFGPFPFYGPIGEAYPYWIWLALLVVILIPSFWVGRMLRKRAQKKRLMQTALSGMGSAQSPVQDFSKIQRQVIRNTDSSKEALIKMLDSLDTGFRSYLVRRCLVPAFDWSESEVIKDIRKHHPKAYQAAGGEVLRILREFRKIKNRDCNREDVDQLLEQSRRTVEKLEKFL